MMQALVLSLVIFKPFQNRLLMFHQSPAEESNPGKPGRAVSSFPLLLLLCHTDHSNHHSPYRRGWVPLVGPSQRLPNGFSGLTSHNRICPSSFKPFQNALLSCQLLYISISLYTGKSTEKLTGWGKKCEIVVFGVKTWVLG